MPMESTVDPARKIVLTRVWGDWTEADIKTYQQDLRNNREFDPQFSQLIDMMGLATVRLTSLSVDRLLRTRVFTKNARCAVIAESDLAYGISRMIELHCEARGISFRAFRGRREAERWLFEEPEEITQA